MPSCDGKNHELVDVYTEEVGYGIEHVVRWCNKCGSVVVDAVVDGITRPGAIKAMWFPSNRNPD